MLAVVRSLRWRQPRRHPSRGDRGWLRRRRDVGRRIRKIPRTTTSPIVAPRCTSPTRSTSSRTWASSWSARGRSSGRRARLSSAASAAASFVFAAGLVLHRARLGLVPLGAQQREPGVGPAAAVRAVPHGPGGRHRRPGEPARPGVCCWRRSSSAPSRACIYWQRHDDLRPYGLAQFLPMLLIPLMLVLFPGRRPTAPLIVGVGDLRAGQGGRAEPTAASSRSAPSSAVTRSSTCWPPRPPCSSCAGWWPDRGTPPGKDAHDALAADPMAPGRHPALDEMRRDRP